MGYPSSWVNFTDATSGNGFEAHIDDVSGVVTPTIAGKYYTGRILVNGVIGDGPESLPVGRGAPVGTINDGARTVTELDGIGAGMGPSVIPYATEPVTTDPSSWTCVGTGCTVTTGAQAPDGTTTAGALTTGSTAAPYIQATWVNATTSPGDWVIFGAWIRSSGAEGTNLWLYSYGATDTFAGAQANSGCGSSCASSGPFQSSISGMWWHPVVAAAQFATGTSSVHGLTLRLFGSMTTGDTVQFWQPFLIYIPASAGISADEIERWRQQLMHGAVPSGMPGGGGILAMHSTHKLYWGSDTNLYRGAAGVMKTDGAFNAVNGYQVNGAPLAASNLSNGTTGSGSVVLATNPTLSGSTLGGHLTQTAANTFAGTCTMSSATSCTATIGTAYSSAPVCVATVQGATPIAGSCGVSGTTVTVTAGSSNSATWGFILIGNPN